MKKFTLLLIALFLLSCFTVSVSAADTSWRMTHGDDTQDALLVGKVMEADGETIKIDVIRTVNGKPAKSPFTIKKNAYQNNFLQASVDDGILVSVSFATGTKSSGTVCYGLYKVQLMQDKKIKMDVNEYDVGFIEWQVNTGIKDDLFGEDGKVFRHTGGDWQTDGELLFDGITWYEDSLDPQYKAPEVKIAPDFFWPDSPSVSKALSYALLVFVLLAIVTNIVIWEKYRKP